MSDVALLQDRCLIKRFELYTEISKSKNAEDRKQNQSCCVRVATSDLDRKHNTKAVDDDQKFTEEGNDFKCRRAWLLKVPEWFKRGGKYRIQPEDEVMARIIATAEEKTEAARKDWDESKVEKKGSNIEDHSVGPALKLTKEANWITWIFFTCLPWIVGCNWWYLGSVISCAPSESPTVAPLPFATYPKILWLPFFVITCVLLWYEMRAFAHTIVAQVMVAGIPTFPLIGRLSYSKFLYVMLLISLIYHFDIFTNGIFIARVLVTDRCVAANNFTVTPERIWYATINHSALRRISGFSFFQCCMAAWFSFYLQPIYSYCYAVPRSPQLQDPIKEKGEEKTGKPDLPKVDYEHKTANQDCPVYEVFFRSDQQHGRALQAISESARMNSLYCLDPEYLNYQTKSWRPIDVHREMQRTNVRFFIFIVETMLLPNLQATFLCFEKAMSYDPNNPEQEGFKDDITLVSVIVSFITGIIYVRSELTAVMKFHALVKSQKWKFDQWTDIICEDTERAEVVTRSDLHKAESAMFKAQRSMVICCILALVGLFFLSYAVIKAIMGTYYCPMGMWNLRWPLVSGCVNLTKHGIYMTP